MLFLSAGLGLAAFAYCGLACRAFLESYRADSMDHRVRMENGGTQFLAAAIWLGLLARWAYASA